MSATPSRARRLAVQEMITSRKNLHLKDIRRLRRCKDERAVLEGPHLLSDALDRGIEPELVLATPQWSVEEAGRRLLPRLPRSPLLVEAGLLAEVTDSDSPRGVVAVVRLPRNGVEALPRDTRGVYVFVDGLQDPGNLGALARSAEAAGATALALAPGSVHPNHPRALRAAAGSLLRLPTARNVEAEGLAQHLAPLAPRWLALAPRGGTSLYEADLSGTVVLLLGAEGPGLSPTAHQRADELLTIPLEAPVESLNATVASALVLFEIRRQRTSVP